MFTKNWYKMLAVFTMTKVDTVNSFDAVNVNNSAGDLCNQGSNSGSAIDIHSITQTILTSITNSTWRGVAFGTGNTPPTADDYNLTGNVISSLSGSYAQNVNADEDSTTLTIVYTLTNTGTADVTIGEIGMFNQGYNRTDVAYKSTYMLERTALDEPVTIPAGGVGKVTYTIRLNYPA